MIDISKDPEGWSACWGTGTPGRPWERENDEVMGNAHLHTIVVQSYMHHKERGFHIYYTKYTKDVPLKSKTVSLASYLAVNNILLYFSISFFAPLTQ